MYGTEQDVHGTGTRCDGTEQDVYGTGTRCVWNRDKMCMEWNKMCMEQGQDVYGME